MNLTRRGWLGAAGAAVGGAAAASAPWPAGAADAAGDAALFRYCLNTSTLQGHKLTLEEEVDLLIAVGYDAMEPWVRELEQHAGSGKSLRDLGKKLADHGKTIESAIGFFDWAVDDAGRRQKALDEVARVMEMLVQVGGKRVALPPAGVTDRTGMDPRVLADRLRPVCELAARTGVQPELELWGFSKTLGRLGDVVQVAIEAAQPNLAILLDVYHLYKGGSDVQGVRYLDGSVLPVIHCNDYPADPPRASISDAQRVYPGDGIAPFKELVRILREVRFRGYFSLELFNREYWKQDPKAVARTGLDKMKAVVREGLA